MPLEHKVAMLSASRIAVMPKRQATTTLVPTAATWRAGIAAHLRTDV